MYFTVFLNKDDDDDDDDDDALSLLSPTTPPPSPPCLDQEKPFTFLLSDSLAGTRKPSRNATIAQSFFALVIHGDSFAHLLSRTTRGGTRGNEARRISRRACLYRVCSFIFLFMRTFKKNSHSVTKSGLGAPVVHLRRCWNIPLTWFTREAARVMRGLYRVSRVQNFRLCFKIKAINVLWWCELI